MARHRHAFARAPLGEPRDTASTSPADTSDVWPGAKLLGWDATDEASWESFPASDPPASRAPRSATSSQDGLSVVTIVGGLFVALLAAACVPLATVAVRSASAVDVASLRALAAAPILLALAVWQRRPHPSGYRQWLAVAGIGVSWTAIGFGAMMLAGGRIAPGLATVIASVQPLLAAVLGLAVLHERIDRWAAIGMALALIGITVAALTAPGEAAIAGSSRLGAAFVFAGAAGLAAGNVITKRFAFELDPISTAGWQLVIGAAVLYPVRLLISPGTPVDVSASLALAIAALAVTTAVGFVVWFVLLRRAPLVTLNVLTFATPIFGLVIGVGWFGERLGTIELAGIMLVVAGVALAVHPPGTSRTPAWECRLAWVLRALLVLAATVHLAQGQVLYAVLCLALIGLLVLPPLLARSSHANVPIELELFALLAVVGDIVLGRVLGLYETAWFDKLLHAGTSSLIGLAAFLIVYALRFTGRLRTSSVVDGFVILLLAVGLGGLWEIAEYAADQLLGTASQGSPVMGPLDDTMWDLVADAIGGLAGAIAGSVYLRKSRRSAERIAAFASIVPTVRGGRSRERRR